MKNKSRWATRCTLFVPTAANSFQKHNRIDDLRVIDTEYEHKDKATTDVSDVSLVMDNIPMHKVISNQTVVQKDVSFGEVDPSRARTDPCLTMKPRCSTLTYPHELSADELISILHEKEKELNKVKAERDFLEREMTITADFVEMISKENEKHKKDITVLKAWSRKAQNAMQHVRTMIRKMYW